LLSFTVYLSIRLFLTFISIVKKKKKKKKKKKRRRCSKVTVKIHEKELCCESPEEDKPATPGLPVKVHRVKRI